MRLLPCFLLLLSSLVLRAADPIEVVSPDQRWKAAIRTGPPLSIELRDARGDLLVRQEAGMKLEHRDVPGVDAKILKVTPLRGDEVIEPPVRQIAAKLRNRYNAVMVSFDDGTALVVRLYDEGLAYRFQTAFPGDMKVVSERRTCRFEGDPTVYFGHDNDFFSGNEVDYDKRPLSELKPGDLASQPLTVRPAGGEGLLVFSESALENYAGQWMRVGQNSIEGTNPGYPKKETQRNDRDIVVDEREPFIARTKGTRAFPWRTVAAAAQDSELLSNALNFLVADPPRLADTAWIKPGKVQWDWWHDWTWDGKKLPINNETYRRYIDFASKNGIPFIVLDEGWYPLGDLTRQSPGIDVPALVKYGRGKNVGVILWAACATVKNQLDQVMPLFDRWGIKGLKIDFFNRDDQKQVEVYWKIAAEAARRKLMLDLHGAHKPAGLQRTYPNVITFEGVRGLEQCKPGKSITPTHDLLLPYTRMVAGPMDYTPGAMKNVQPEKFSANGSSPMSQGTRCHELAKYVIFDSPLQMLCDAPPSYEREKLTMEFLRPVPTTWDASLPQGGRIGEFAAMARLSGENWFLGAMTNEEKRDFTFDLGMLGAGTYELTIWQDGPNAAGEATDFEQKKIRVKRGDKLPIKMAPGGGWVAIARPGA